MYIYLYIYIYTYIYTYVYIYIYTLTTDSDVQASVCTRPTKQRFKTVPRKTWHLFTKANRTSCTQQGCHLDKQTSPHCRKVNSNAEKRRFSPI